MPNPNPNPAPSPSPDPNQVVERCKKTKECPHCGALNGLVKRVGCMRVVHENPNPNPIPNPNPNPNPNPKP
eukprot:scaffold64644_cov50-Phaeocystis_antarctica.AAC.1